MGGTVRALQFLETGVCNRANKMPNILISELMTNFVILDSVTQFIKRIGLIQDEPDTADNFNRRENSLADAEVRIAFRSSSRYKAKCFATRS